MTDEYFGTIAITILYLLSILGWGGLVARLLKTAGGFWQELAVRAVAGCSALYALYIVLSFAGHLHPIETMVVAGIGVLLACAELTDLARKGGAAASGVKNWERGDHIVGALVILFVLLQAAWGLTPLMFYDLQAYHFLAPAQFLVSGDLRHIPWNVLTNTPLAMQFTAGMSLAVDGSGQVLKLLFTLIGSLAGLGVYEFIRPAGLRPALLAALCAFAFPEFLLMQTLGAVDLAIAGLMIFGAIWARRAIAEKSWQLATLAGLAFGLAVGSRYQALVHVSWLVAVLIAEAKLNDKSLPMAELLRPMMMIGGLTALLLSPWVIRNYLHLGNPVFPLMQSVWASTTEWSPAQMNNWNVGAFGPPFSALNSVQQVLAPIGVLLIQPSNGLFGMGLLLGALIAVVVSRDQIRLAAFFGLSGLVIWGLLRPGAGSALLRYNALSILFLLAATGAILGSSWVPSAAGRAIAVALSTGSMVIGIIHVQSILPAAQSLVNVEARKAIHRMNVPSWQAFDYINQKLDRQHDKILLIGETRAFWLNVPYIAPSAFNGPQLDQIFGGNTNPDHWQLALSERGLTHLLVSNSEIERWHKQYGYLNLKQEQAEKLNTWMHGLQKVFDDNQGTVVLALRTQAQ